MTTVNPFYKELYTFLVVIGFNAIQAQYIVAQSAHETGNFTSTIFKDNNNLFGMKAAGQKLVTGEKHGHAVYASWKDSARDYRKYYLRHAYLPYYNTPEDFVQALKNHAYFEAKIEEYKTAVKKFHQLYFGHEAES